MMEFNGDCFEKYQKDEAEDNLNKSKYLDSIIIINVLLN